MAGDRRFDVVIVGAGPAGCVLACRLTEDPERTVALLEAGPDYGLDPSAWPADLRAPPRYSTQLALLGLPPCRATRRPPPPPAPHPDRRRQLDGQRLRLAAGLRRRLRRLGGPGNPGWSFADLLPSFRRAEADPLGGSLHGIDGPVPVFRVAEANLSPIDRAFVAAAEALGFPRLADLNGDASQHPGVGPTPKNVANGMRMSAAFTYLAPARQRPNLTLIADALVDRVSVEEGRATGVRTADGREVRGRQIILCAGAYGSPAILLRSGIGPAAELRALDIPIVAGRPGVGAHLLDHPALLFATDEERASVGGAQATGGQSSVAAASAYVVRPEYAPAAPSNIPLLIKARSRQAMEEIDLHMTYGYARDEARGRWDAFFVICLELARSTGRVRLSSPDPAATLAIDHGYFADPADLEALCDGAELSERLLSTQPLATVVEPVPGKVPGWHGRDELRAWVRAHVTTTFHPSNTCRMGPTAHPGAVVDHVGRVYGVAGLRVADAAIFPSGPRANLHCTVVAVAEKLADAIRRDVSA